MARIASLNCTAATSTSSPRARADIGGCEAASDLSLVQRCAERDALALQELVSRYQQKLYPFLRRMLGSAEDAEEAVQDVFLKVWQQAARFEGRASFATWLYRVATNVAYDRLRHRKTQPQTTTLLDGDGVSAINAEEQALNGLERSERRQRLDHALQSLRAEDRLLLHLYYAEEREYAEIGQITGVAYPVLKVRLMRARRRLQAALGGLTSEEDA